MPATFVVSPDKPANEVTKSTTEYEVFLRRVVPAAKVTKEGHKPEILKSTEAPNGYFHSKFSNGFIGAAFAAYSAEHHLIISPDDVWIAITTALSRYINAHAEEMRELFVSHQGQKELIVSDVGSITSVDWDKLIDQMSELISQNTKNDIQQWIEPDFTTTTKLTRKVGSIVLMASMKAYFSYKFNLCCGLPSVTMLGTLEDWQKIRQRADRLLEFKQEVLTEWHAILVPILDEFIKSFSGEVDTNFWNTIAHQTGGGSGPRYLSGWILAFIPFNDKNEYYLNPSDTVASGNYGIMNVNDVPTSAVSVPVIIDDNGTQYDTTFYAGHLYATVGPTPDAIQPYLGWLMINNGEIKSTGKIDALVRHTKSACNTIKSALLG